jgi:hypothetical protein
MTFLPHRPVRVRAAAYLALMPLTLACMCGGDPTPRTETCTLGGTTPTVDALQLMFGASRGPLVDGDAVPEVFGGQGGSHWSFGLVLEGDGLGGCADVDLRARVDGDVVASYVGTVTMTGTDRGGRTSEIVVFGPTSFGARRCVEVTASAFGQATIVRRLTQGDPRACDRVPDAGMPDAGPPAECGDFVVGGDEDCDEPDPSRCTTRCMRPRCDDGVASPGEACFRATGATARPPAPIDLLAYIADAERLEVVGATPTELVRYAAGSLAPIGDPVALAATPRALVAGDLDGDGAPDDLAIADEAGLHVLLGDAGAGGGPFALGAPSTTALGSEPIALLALDLDADDADELLVALASGDVHLLDATAVDLSAPVLSGLTEPVSVTALRTETGLDTIAVARGGQVELYTRSGEAPFALTETLPRAGGALLFGLAAGPAPLLVEAGDEGLVVHERSDGIWLADEVDAFGPVSSLSVVRRDGRAILLAASPYVSRAFAVSMPRPRLPYWLPLGGGTPTRAVLGLPDGTVVLSRADGIVALVPGE